jgi:ubiquinone/menaquinone biosynthesis C-methylase UbiE
MYIILQLEKYNRFGFNNRNMGLLSKIFSNTRKPEGFFGRMMVNGMNGGGHARLAEWGLSFVKIAEDADVLDVGCGGGANIARHLIRCPRGKVTGIDYSPVSVKKSREVNAAAIAAGRCKVVEGSADALPFEDVCFDLVTAFETVYFWPEIEDCFRGVRRVLKEGGRFLIVNEDDGLTGNNDKWEKMIDGMHTYTPDELQKHLAAGFHDITVHLDDQHHWLGVTAVR